MFLLHHKSCGGETQSTQIPNSRHRIGGAWASPPRKLHNGILVSDVWIDHLEAEIAAYRVQDTSLEAPESPLAVTMVTKGVYFKGCLSLPAEVDLVHCITEFSLPIWSPWRLYCSLANSRHLGRCIRELIASDVLWNDHLVANIVAYVYMVTISCHFATVWRLPLNSFPWWRNLKDCLNVLWRNLSMSQQRILVYLLNDDSWGLRGGVWKQIWIKKVVSRKWNGSVTFQLHCCWILLQVQTFELHECANDTNSDGEGPATHSSSLKIWWEIWTFTCA